VGDIISGVVLQ